MANKIVHESDFLLVLGSRLDIRQTGNQVNDFVPNGKIAWVDIDINELDNPRVRVDWKINACISEFCKVFSAKLQKINNVIENNNIINYVNEVSKRHEDVPIENCKNIQPRELMDSINSLVKKSKTTIITGVGCHQHWAARHLSFKPNYTRHLSSGGHGAMGYDLPSAVGAAMVYPNDKVLCIVGDGSILMNIQELATIKERNLNIKIIVVNNRRLGMVLQFQLITWGADPTTGDVEAINFQSIGQGFGIRSMKLNKVSEIESKMNEFFSISGPALLEVILDYNADVVPMLLAGQKMNEMWDGREKMNKVALVTGGSRGIGKAIAEELIKKDYSVAIGYYKNKILAEEIASNNDKALLKIDIRSADSIKDAFSYVVSNLGSIDILVNNAGISQIRESFESLEDKDYGKLCGKPIL